MTTIAALAFIAYKRPIRIKGILTYRERNPQERKAALRYLKRKHPNLVVNE